MELVNKVLEVLNSDQQFFCSVPSISKACKAAVQTASPLTVAVYVRGKKEIYAFIKWLTEYCRTPNTVRSGSINMDGSFMSDAERDEADALLAQFLQLAEKAGCKLEFHKFCSTGFVRRILLKSLPEETLTCLQLNGISRGNMAALLDVSIGLRHLTNLESLELTSFGSFENRDPAAGPLALDVCMPAIAQLTKLTSLVLEHVCTFNHEQLPAQNLRRLVVSYDDIPQLPVAGFSDFTNLTHLSIRSDHGHRALVLGPLPVQLVDLEFKFGNHMSSSTAGLNISSVTQLEKVSVNDSYETAADLLALRMLPRLQHVDLHSEDTETLVEASAAWPLLPQLHSVCLHCPDNDISVASLGQLMQNLAATTSLTRLLFEDVRITGPGLLPPFCRGLANLSGLRELCLVFEDADQAAFVAGDVQQLSALTQLIELHLKPVGLFVMDDDVVVLSLSLQRLRELYVPVRSVPVLAAICTGGSRDLRVVGIYAASDSLWQDATWQQYVSESRFRVDRMIESFAY